MIGIDTGRSRTISIGGSFAGQGQGSGTGVGLGGYNTNCSIFVGICVDGSDQDLRGGPRFTIVTGYPNYGFGWNTDGTVVFWEASLGDFTVDAGDADSGTFGAGSDTEPWSVSVNGTFNATFEVEERLLITNPNTIVDEATELEDGYPKWGGDTFFRGSPATAVEYLEVLPEGATVTFSLAFASVSVSFSAVYSGPEVRFYRDHVLRVSCEGFAGIGTNVPSEFCSVTMSEGGVTTGTDWEYTYNSGDGVLNSANTDLGAYVSMSGNGPGSIIDGGGYNRADLYRTYEMPTKYRWDARSYAYDTLMDQALTWRFHDKFGVYHEQSFAGSFIREVEQLRESVFMFSGPFATTYDSTSRDINTKAWCNARVTPTSLTAAGEFAENWRCWIHGKGYPIFDTALPETLEVTTSSTSGWSAGSNTSIASGLQITTSGGVGSATKTWASPGFSFESYRWLKVRIRSVGNANVPVVLTIGSKEWNIVTGADGTWVERYVDLCCASNATWDYDINSSRYPVTHDTRIPLSIGSNAWGVNYTTSLSIGQIPDARVIEVSDIDAVRRDFCQASFLADFRPQYEAWESPSDTTYAWTGIYLNTDGRNSDLPDQYRVVPDVGDPYYVHYDATQMLTIWEQIYGWNLTLAGSFPDDFHNEERLGFFIEGAGYYFDDGVWEVLDRKNVWGHTVRMQPLWDWIKVYPGAGDVFNGTYEEFTPLATHWAGRSRTQGIVFKIDNTPNPGLTVVSDPSVGSALTGTYGNFYTSIPYAKNATTIDWFPQAGSLNYASTTHWDLAEQRICWREDSVSVSGILSYCVSPWKRHALLFGGEEQVLLGLSSNYPDPATFDIIRVIDKRTVVDGCIQYDNKGGLWIWCTWDGTVYKKFSDNDGKTTTSWEDIGMGVNVAARCAPDGIIYEYWTSGSSIVGRIIDRTGGIIKSTFTAIASGVDDDKIAVDVYSVGGGGFQVRLWYSSSGVKTSVASKNGYSGWA